MEPVSFLFPEFTCWRWWWSLSLWAPSLDSARFLDLLPTRQVLTVKIALPKKHSQIPSLAAIALKKKDNLYLGQGWRPVLASQLSSE
jgi:hypothetical protein